MGAVTSFLRGWERRTCEGGLLLLAPDPKLGVIRIRTGAPLRPLRAVADEIAATGPDGSAATLRPPPRPLVTAEGEHGAVFEYDVESPKLRFRRVVAIVLGDHELTIFDGRAFSPEGHDLTDKVAALASTFPLGLGSDRWRPFVYAPPPGWNRRARAHCDLWIAPSYPTTTSVISVFHARPMESRAPATDFARIFMDLPAEFGRAEPLDREELKLPSGLGGTLVTYRAVLDGQTRLATTASLSDGRYVHVLRLECDEAQRAAHGPIFARLLGSAEPIPSPPKAVETFDQYAE
jgi:hypothetical protein